MTIYLFENPTTNKRRVVNDVVGLSANNYREQDEVLIAVNGVGVDNGGPVVYDSQEIDTATGKPVPDPYPSYVTKDSGKREEMPSGSARDTREGKGRFELVSPFALARLAGVYERGAAKYESRNWEKGQPYSRFLDSAMRHLNRYAMGWQDEDHLAQAAWNIFAIMHFQEIGGMQAHALDDLPHYQDGPKDE